MQLIQGQTITGANPSDPRCIQHSSESRVACLFVESTWLFEIDFPLTAQWVSRPVLMNLYFVLVKKIKPFTFKNLQTESQNWRYVCPHVRGCFYALVFRVTEAECRSTSATFHRVTSSVYFHSRQHCGHDVIAFEKLGFPSTLKGWPFKFLRFEERLRNAPFSWLSTCGQ